MPSKITVRWEWDGGAGEWVERDGDTVDDTGQTEVQACATRYAAEAPVGAPDVDTFLTGAVVVRSVKVGGNWVDLVLRCTPAGNPGDVDLATPEGWQRA